MNTLPSTLILQRAHARLRKTAPGYSLRRLASQLKIAPSFLSDIFKGKKPLPPKYLASVAKHLELDEIALEKLKFALLKEQCAPELASVLAQVKRKEPSLIGIPGEEVARDQFALLHAWYLLPLLDLTTCEGFSDDPDWIASKLGITSEQARGAWRILLELGCVAKTEKGWTKSTEHIRFPSKKSEPVIRDYHARALELAKAQLKKTSERDFAERLISGMSVAVNPAKIEEARQRLQAAIVEVSQILTEGPCTEVFQVQAQMFPVTQREKS